MRPHPIIPTVLPYKSKPIGRSHCPRRIEASAVCNCRSKHKIIPNVSSATGMVGASGVFVTIIPNSFAASRSTESRPMPQREITFKPLAFISTFLVKGSTPAIMPIGFSSSISLLTSSSVNFLSYGLVTMFIPFILLRSFRGDKSSFPNEDVVIKIFSISHFFPNHFQAIPAMHAHKEGIQAPGYKFIALFYPFLNLNWIRRNNMHSHWLPHLFTDNLISLQRLFNIFMVKIS